MTLDIFTALKQKLPILDVVGDSVALKKAGSYFKGPCPFHAEKTASFTVTPGREIFYCFGCHASGDVISFVAKKENLTQAEAVEFLIERYGLDLPRGNSYRKELAEDETYVRAWHLFTQWAHQQLTPAHPAFSYLASRGIQPQTIMKAQLGVVPSSSQLIPKLLKAAQAQSLVAADLINAHIIFEGKKGLFTPFEDRIIFPIHQIHGKVVGCGGRVYRADDSRPKYYNSHEHALFNKGQLLYGLDVAKRAILEEQKVIVVEGYMDCIALWQDSLTYSVATLGTACTKEQLHQLSRYAQTAYFMYDGDNAGQKAMTKCAELCWQQGIEARIVMLPEGKDPASLVATTQPLKPLLGKAKDPFAFYLKQYGADFFARSLSERLSIVRDIVQMINKIEIPVTRHLLLQKAAIAFDLPLEVLAPHEKNIPVKKTITAAPARIAKSPLRKQLESLSESDRLAAVLLLAHHRLLSADDQLLSYDVLGNVLPEIKDHRHFFAEQQSADFHTFFQSCSAEGKERISTLLSMVDEKKALERIDELRTYLRKKRWKEAIDTVKRKLAHAQKVGEEEAIKQILTEYTVLQQKLLHKEAV
jgi:DNA primase